MNNKSILILEYQDLPYVGHGYNLWKTLLNERWNVYFYPYLWRFTADCQYYYKDIHGNKILNKYWFYTTSKIKSFFQKKGKIPNKDEYCFFNVYNQYAGSAEKILNNIGITPDIIVIAWCDYYISPKTVYELYQLTKAKIVVLMVDAHLISGGCHFPCDCTQYESGCTNCPVLKRKKVARQLYNEKEKYLSKIPLTVVGSSFDLFRAKKTSFLKNAEMINLCHVPETCIPENTIDVRINYEISENDFLILWGAQSTNDKRKGFSYFISALEVVSRKISDRRNICVFLLANDNVDLSGYDLGRNIKILQPGFLGQDKLFKALGCSDLYISTSIDDSGPMMINFSLSCGTPVLSFPIGIALDLVKHKKTGYMANYLDIKSLADGIMYFYNLDENEASKIRTNCVDLIKENKEATPWYKKIIE